MTDEQSESADLKSAGPSQGQIQRVVGFRTMAKLTAHCLLQLAERGTIAERDVLTLREMLRGKA